MLHAHSFFCLGFPRSDLPPSLFLSSGRCYHPHTDIAPIQTKKITFYKNIPSESSICIFFIWKYQKPKLWHFQRDCCPPIIMFQPTKSTNLPDQRQPMNFQSCNYDSWKYQLSHFEISMLQKSNICTYVVLFFLARKRFPLSFHQRALAVSFAWLFSDCQLTAMHWEGKIHYMGGAPSANRALRLRDLGWVKKSKYTQVKTLGPNFCEAKFFEAIASNFM